MEKRTEADRTTHSLTMEPLVGSNSQVSEAARPSITSSAEFSEKRVKLRILHLKFQCSHVGTTLGRPNKADVGVLFSPWATELY